MKQAATTFLSAINLSHIDCVKERIALHYVSAIIEYDTKSSLEKMKRHRIKKEFYSKILKILIII
ncbi:hypothetical protein FOG69_00785 [Bacillus amyloliquefaciens]|nr:hypothetical protein FOG69_00785 [Bacillus amyloliquefaciens]